MGAGGSMELTGRRFLKMTGSGNDFVVFDTSDGPTVELERPETIRAICARGMGVGADGLVVLEREGPIPAIRYYNADGTRADLCGNATLCAVALTARSQAPPPAIRTDAGELAARIVDGRPEVDLEPVTRLTSDVEQIRRGPGEVRIGFAIAGVPHLVVLCEDLGAVDLMMRGPILRRHAWLGADGANVNWVARSGGRWRYRTFERGVEAETLACGTGAVAAAALLTAWREAKSPVELVTASGLPLVATLPPTPDGRASLRGEGRLVYEGKLGDIR